jgi:hypothetical protein
MKKIEKSRPALDHADAMTRELTTKSLCNFEYKRIFAFFDWRMYEQPGCV